MENTSQKTGLAYQLMNCPKWVKPPEVKENGSRTPPRTFTEEAVLGQIADWIRTHEGEEFTVNKLHCLYSFPNHLRQIVGNFITTHPNVVCIKEVDYICKGVELKKFKYKVIPNESK